MTSIPLEKFDSEIKETLIEVSSSSLGARILACSDEFFAEASNLLKPGPSQSLKGQFGPNGALYDGWETRRHNPAFDWVIIKLASEASVEYVDIDTAHFIGNEGPEGEVLGISKEDPKHNDDWEVVCPKVPLGPGSRHIFQTTGKTYTHLMLRMIPDGGFGRFRAYGLPTPPSANAGLINLASAVLSARAVAASDANFAPPRNLLLPGRGHDMSDGWETRRSRAKTVPDERQEWAVIKLACKGTILYTEVDSAWHVGNYPVACSLEAALSDGEPTEWTSLVSKKPLGPHRQHWFKAETDGVWSHVRIRIYPDGGLKRLRVYGYPGEVAAAATPTLHLLPLTPEAFAPYGHVIQGFGLPTSAPKGIATSVANQGTAHKYHKLAPVVHTYPEGLLHTDLSIGLVRANPIRSPGETVPVRMLERHKHTSQAFVPLGKGAPAGVTPLQPGGSYVVIAALDKDNEPDKSTLRAFLATAAQGVSYNQGIWHHSLMTVEAPLDYAAIEAQIGDGSILDCETRKYEEEPFAYLQVPEYSGVQPHAPVIPRPSLLSRLPSLGSDIPVVPITPSAFAPFGEVIQAYPAAASRLPGQVVFGGPPAPAEKYMWLAKCHGENMAVSVFRSTVKEGLARGKPFELHHMERHPKTTQAFIPMGKAGWEGKGEDALPPGGAMIVVVAANGKDDRPDPSTIKAFMVESSQGINYATGVWHHPALTLDATLDYAVVESQMATDGSEPSDCELIEYAEPFGRITVP